MRNLVINLGYYLGTPVHRLFFRLQVLRAKLGILYLLLLQSVLLHNLWPREKQRCSCQFCTNNQCDRRRTDCGCYVVVSPSDSIIFWSYFLRRFDRSHCTLSWLTTLGLMSRSFALLATECKQVMRDAAVDNIFRIITASSDFSSFGHFVWTFDSPGSVMRTAQRRWLLQTHLNCVIE